MVDVRSVDVVTSSAKMAIIGLLDFYPIYVEFDSNFMS